jgi:hypothetical protein
MVIEMMLISGVGFSVMCGVALSGAVDKGAEELGWYFLLLTVLPTPVVTDH